MSLFLLFLSLQAALGQEEHDPARPNMGIGYFHHSIDARTSIATDDAGWAPGRYASARFVASSITDPMMYQYADGEVVSVLSSATMGDLIASVSFDRVRIGVDVPVYFSATSDVISSLGAGLGDVSIDIKGTLLDRNEAGYGLALSARGTAPTGGFWGQTKAPLVDPRGSSELQLIVDKRVGNTLFAVNLGARMSAIDGQTNTVFLFRPYMRGSAGYFLTDHSGLSLDLVAYSSQRLPSPTGAPVEFLAGGWTRFNERVVLRGGIGQGLTQGVGAPAFRAMASVAFEPHKEKDADFDGVVDRLDECVFEAEDYDGFEDIDGCPEPDNDGDGVLDEADMCDSLPEDYDGFEDDDGCPEDMTLAHFRANRQGGDVLSSARISLVSDKGEVRFGAGDFRVVVGPGVYSVVIRADGYETIEREVSVVVGQSVEDIFEMKPQRLTGLVDLFAHDAGQHPKRHVRWVEGSGPWKAADESVRLSTGLHSLLVRAKGYGLSVASVEVVDGKLTEVDAELHDSRVSLKGTEVFLSQPVGFKAQTDELEGERYVLDDLSGFMFDHSELSGFEIVVSVDSQVNASLAERRAIQIKRYLVARGVDKGRLKVNVDTNARDGDGSQVRVLVHGEASSVVR